MKSEKQIFIFDYCHSEYLFIIYKETETSALLTRITSHEISLYADDEVLNFTLFTLIFLNFGHHLQEVIFN